MVHPRAASCITPAALPLSLFLSFYAGALSVRDGQTEPGRSKTLALKSRADRNLSSAMFPVSSPARARERHFGVDDDDDLRFCFAPNNRSPTGPPARRSGRV